MRRFWQILLKSNPGRNIIVLCVICSEIFKTTSGKFFIFRVLAVLYLVVHLADFFDWQSLT